MPGWEVTFFGIDLVPQTLYNDDMFLESRKGYLYFLFFKKKGDTDNYVSREKIQGGTRETTLRHLDQIFESDGPSPNSLSQVHARAAKPPVPM
jgi:hypothetical protein